MEIVEDHELSGRVTLEAARPVMDYIDLAATRAGEAYVEAQQLLLAEGDRVRRDLLDDLLAGREPGSAARLAARAPPGSRGRRACSSSRCRVEPRRGRARDACRAPRRSAAPLRHRAGAADRRSRARRDRDRARRGGERPSRVREQLRAGRSARAGGRRRHDPGLAGGAPGRLSRRRRWRCAAVAAHRRRACRCRT